MKNNFPIFVVNLLRDHEKKAHMDSVANTIGVKFEFIDAVYGKDLSQSQIDEVYDESLSLKELGRGLSRGELGCALSHLSIYQKMVNEGIETALILEDDVDTSSNLLDVLNATRHFPDDWEVMLLGYYSETATERVSMASFFGKSDVTTSHQAVRLVEIAFGTHGYMINLRGAKRLLKTLTKVIKPIDHYTGSGSYINMYALSPRVISLNEKLKAMGCIDIDREVQFESIKKDIMTKNISRRIWCFLKSIKVIFWLKKLPSRLFPIDKYIIR
jgi:glycosyl transferase family 25